jgi:hypothetical protein
MKIVHAIRKFLVAIFIASYTIISIMCTYLHAVDLALGLSDGANFNTYSEFEKIAWCIGIPGFIVICAACILSAGALILCCLKWFFTGKFSV